MKSVIPQGDKLGYKRVFRENSVYKQRPRYDDLISSPGDVSGHTQLKVLKASLEARVLTIEQ
ncbi:hypothetical protein BPOR_0255g00030 [Botrytis porri]|uniref:Uncharacterized protein n=1 Tax=Botrytis porri TaxID=87229 RepID=A0A4Z1KNK4_9HELO|nr:hypothetical protein BPOR_0255g00030 [Botrytis porri]